ncbi:MAG TPA: hypothetical protein VGX92_20180 [Pyrinomonadaceae bacterium]|jgi:hypothetical protein|nr:hypothetical protein [Pyrinomonadaceae bacterium]
MRNGDQVRNITKLISDIRDIKAGTTVPPELKDELESDVKDMLDGAQPPDPGAVQTLITDLRNALADGQLDKKEIFKLQADLDAVLTSANIESGDVKEVVDDVKAILEGSTFPEGSKDIIIADLKAIGQEFQEQHPNL